MDRFEHGLSKEDNIDSWDMISDDCCDDMQDFEIIKVLHELEKPLFTETETLADDAHISNDHFSNTNNNIFRKNATFTTDDSGETTDEDYEDIKKCKQDIKKDNNNFVDVNASKLSTKKEHKFKRKQTLLEPKTISKKKDENINKNKLKKSTIKKSRTLLNSANLGALLTAFGLSLIFLNTSDKTQTTATEQEAKNLSENLLDAIKSTNITEKIIDDEKFIEKLLPTSINKTLLEQKTLKSKILKRIDRKIKQQIRGCDVKPLKKEKKVSKPKAPKIEIGPLLQDDEFYANNSSTTSSKPLSYRDAVLSCKNRENKENRENIESRDNRERRENRENETCSSKITPDLIMDYDITKTKAEMMNKFLDNDIKKFTETSSNIEVDEDGPGKKLKCHSDIKKKPNCSSIYRDFIKAEMLFKKILNNSYEIPKPKTPADLAYNIENKINILTEDNITLSNIIEEQENLLRQIQDKIEYKKEILEKRSQQKNILQKRLKFANWMKQKREQDDEKPSKKKLGENILNMVVSNIQNKKNNSKSTTEIATRYAPQNINEDKYKNKNEEDTAIYVKRKLYLIKRHEDLQHNMELKKRKDEEHLATKTKLPEKCDPKRAWTKKKTEF